MADSYDHAPGDRILRDGSTSPSSVPRSGSPSLELPPIQTPTMAALAALQYLPIPILVLSSQKTVVLANEAMGRLLEIEFKSPVTEGWSVTNVLQGRHIAELGVDILENGLPIAVSWEHYLNSIVDDPVTIPDRAQSISNTPWESGGSLPTASTLQYNRPDTPSNLPRLTSTSRTGATVCNTSVDVIITPHGGSHRAPKLTNSTNLENALRATLIVSVWNIEDTQYYTLTFMDAQIANGVVARTTPTLSQNKWVSSASSLSLEKRSDPVSEVINPSFQSPDFPPQGSPLKTLDNVSLTASISQKKFQMKADLLNSISMPAYAMWKDEDFGIPNKALLQLLPKDSTWNSDRRPFLSQFRVWTEDFRRELTINELPILEGHRIPQLAENRRIGIRHPVTDTPIIFDITCESVLHETTGEYLGDITVFKDITAYTKEIAAQVEVRERQFETIANFMPILVWTTKASGEHDWYSKRWYDYTGLSVEESLGEGWRLGFHPEDMPATQKKWQHSLKTGEEYNTEYRARRHDGVWRWMLGRALPFYDDQGRIVKWFGTCTDIHDLVEARETARQTKAQLLRVIEHAKITLWAVNRQHELILLEGDREGFGAAKTDQAIGRIFFEIFEDLNDFRQPVQDVLDGKVAEVFIETFSSTQRYYRSRLVPMWSRSRVGGVEGDSFIDGVYGVYMDVTELKDRERQLQEQEKENSRLLVNEAAAKEASRMKSQFLANMSHEIRTPIAGVIGMSELLLDMNLSEEQKDYTENIQRSANSLLAVINDILDFSKVESGRLDVEEVQFSPSVILRDVSKMMAFAAQRKNIGYESAVQPEVEQDLKVVGDPGRLRQILTNLLTNSIKFTFQGFVRLAATITDETKETVTVAFTVDDTGIGIEEGDRKRLFKPFSQADSSTARRFGGTGLGLTISKNLVQLMHGNISLVSKLGQGTSATFTIPFKRAPSQNDAPPLISPASVPYQLESDISVLRRSSEGHTPQLSATKLHDESVSNDHSHGSLQHMQPAPENSTSIPESSMELLESEREKIHILVVEDNHINQKIALKTIKRLHFNVSAVYNGQEAIEWLRQKPSSTYPRPDIILMDVQMPVRDGYSATQAIRANLDHDVSNLPIIAMTASAIHGDKEKCQQAGMDDYLAKPVNRKVLERMLVEWAIRGKRRLAKPLHDSAGDNDHASGALSSIETTIEGSSAIVDINKNQISQAPDKIEAVTQSTLLEDEFNCLQFQSDTALMKSNGEHLRQHICVTHSVPDTST